MGKAPGEVISADVLGFITAQHTGGGLARMQAVGDSAGVGVSAISPSSHAVTDPPIP